MGGAVLLCALFFYSGCSSIEKYERLAREGNVEAQFYCATYHQEEAYEFQEDAADAKPEKKPYLVKQAKAHWRKFEEFCKMAAENDHHEAQLLLIEYYFRGLNDFPEKVNNFKWVLQRHAYAAKTLECNSLKYVDRLLKLNTPDSLEIALVHCNTCVFSTLKNRDTGIELGGRLENAVKAAIARLKSTGAESFRLTTELSMLKAKYPAYFIDIVSPDIAIPVPSRFNSAGGKTAKKEGMLLKKFTIFLSNKMAFSQFKEINPKAKISYFSENNIIWAKAVIKEKLYEEHYFFKASQEKIYNKQFKKLQAVLNRVEIVPYFNSVLEFKKVFSPLFVSGTADLTSQKVEDHLWTCEAFLNIPRRRILLDGISIQLLDAAHNVKIKPFNEKSPDFKAWQQKMKAQANQKTPVRVETPAGFKYRSVNDAVNFLTITPPRLKEVEEAFLKCHGMTVKVILELNNK